MAFATRGHYNLHHHIPTRANKVRNLPPQLDGIEYREGLRGEWGEVLWLVHEVLAVGEPGGGERGVELLYA